jgi:hypothetical protein
MENDSEHYFMLMFHYDVLESSPRDCIQLVSISPVGKYFVYHECNLLNTISNIIVSKKHYDFDIDHVIRRSPHSIRYPSRYNFLSKGRFEKEQEMLEKYFMFYNDEKIKVVTDLFINTQLINMKEPYLQNNIEKCIKSYLKYLKSLDYLKYVSFVRYIPHDKHEFFDDKTFVIGNRAAIYHCLDRL